MLIGELRIKLLELFEELKVFNDLFDIVIIFVKNDLYILCNEISNLRNEIEMLI